MGAGACELGGEGGAGGGRARMSGSRWAGDGAAAGSEEVPRCGKFWASSGGWGWG